MKTEEQTANQTLTNKINQLQNELTERDFEIRLFRETSDAVNQQFELDKLLDFIAHRAQELIQAETLLIPILNEDCSEYTYRAGCGKNADEIIGESLPLDFGICGWVWKHKRPWWRGVLNSLSDTEKNRWEKEAGSVIVVPLIGKNHFLGGIAGIDKIELGDFRRRDLNILMMFASQVSVAIENALYFEQMKAAKEEAESLHAELEVFNAELENIIEDRTYSLKVTNEALGNTIETLKETQNQLVQAEKMASLGSLVAGISHEINTPVGISVTAASHIEEQLSELKSKLSNGKMKKSDLDHFIQASESGLVLLRQNLDTASHLIKSFKLVAADQITDDVRDVYLKRYIDDIILTHKPQLKPQNITLLNRVDDSLHASTHPGSLAQVISNLILNSVIHAFPEDTFSAKNKTITIDSHIENSTLHLQYHDNGIGMEKHDLEKLFDPFFTTRRGKGSYGLGMSVSYNIINSLGGDIQASSMPGEGLQISISIPVQPQ